MPAPLIAQGIPLLGCCGSTRAMSFPPAVAFVQRAAEMFQTPASMLRYHRVFILTEFF